MALRFNPEFFHIVYVITRSDCFGGAQTHVTLLSEEMKNKGYKVTVIVGGNGPLIKILENKGIKVISVNSFIREINLISEIKTIINLFFIFKKIKPSIIHAHSFKAGVFIRFLSKIGLIKKCIFTAHGWSHIKTAVGIRKLFYKYLERFLNSSCSVLVNVCDSDYDYAIKNYLGSKKNSIVIHNSVKNFKNKTLPRVYKPNIESLEIITISRMDEPKNPFMLIQGLSFLKINNWKLTIIGDGKYLPELKILVKKKNLSKNITFKGEQQEVYSELIKSHIFILCSKSEGFPKSILEAMQLGKPVIASDVGGISEAIIPKLNGDLLFTQDPKELTKKLSYFLKHPEQIYNYGLNSQKFFKEKFNLDKMISKTQALYK
tara:strand:- start:5166 stop:6290 length:1125 start_codon:yes stop_codon:yes gene_type:complete